MSEIIKREDGTEEEVFTATEIEEQKQAAIQQFKAENPDKTEELNALQEELKVANEKLAKADDKSQNFATLRKAKEEAEGKLADFTKSVDEKIALSEKRVLEGVMQDHYNDTVKALVGEDEELKKKVEFHYKRLGDTAATKEEISNKLRDAYLLATKQDAGDNFNANILASGGVSRLNIKPSDKSFTPEEKELGKKIAQAGGIKLEDKDFLR